MLACGRGEHDFRIMNTSSPAFDPNPDPDRKRERVSFAGAADRPGFSAPADLPDRILYRDGLVLAIDKPAGIPVHAGPGGGPNLEHWFPLLRFGLPKPPALAHRLDRDTSGCLVLGRHKKALRRLGRLFAEGQVEKVYWAVVRGVPRDSEGCIEAPLLKQPRGIVGWRMIADPQGQRAVTDYRVLGAEGGLAWLELRPRTGRTHQIRVHCAVLGTPVVGDSFYGEPTYGGPADRPLHLHARAIALPLYPAKPPVAVTAPVPPHMRSLLAATGWRGDDDAAMRSEVA